MFREKLWLGITVIILLTLVFGACTSTSKSSEITDSDIQGATELALSDALLRGCKLTEASRNFNNVDLAVGETAVDFALQDTQGNTVSLAGLLIEKPVVMVFGSFT